MKIKINLINRLSFLILTIGLINCNGDAPETDTNELSAVTPAQFDTPLNNTNYAIGDPVELSIKVNNPEGITNLAVYVNEQPYAENLTAKNQSVILKTDSTSRVGKYNLKLTYTDAEGKSHEDNRTVYFFSDVEPALKTAEILATFPHAKTSYTQGLEFYNGKLFEGTGQYKQSILAEVELNSGKKLREIPLEGSIFGEGITILNDRIYQITYRTEECYVYDMDFNLLNTFKYTGEGWGLCNNGKSLIMSNGSQEIVWRNPETFEIEHAIEVFDDKTSVGNLNELELINGRLFVNLYTENRIAEVDTATGKVLSYIDCEALYLDAKEPGNDVLNGIAYNPASGKIYMTGKWWSKLYEVRFN